MTMLGFFNRPSNRDARYRWWHAFSWSKGWLAGYTKRAEAPLKDQWKVEDYGRLVALLQQRLNAHALESPRLEFGSAPGGVRFWCRECRRPWPCSDAAALMSFSDESRPVKYTLELIPVLGDGEQG